MKRNWKKIVSLFLSVLLTLSVTGVPVMAADEKAAPTEVESCTVGGFMPEYLALEFADTDWMNAINSVTVNGSAYTKGTLSWSSSGNLWEIGSVAGAYGSYTALKLTNPSYPAEIKITADGYQELIVNVTKDTGTYPYVYTATITGSGNNGGETTETYTATASACTNGTLTLSAESDLKAGDTVTITATPDQGYEADNVTVVGASGTTVEVTKGENSYTFSMPSENVTVSATFKEATPVEAGKLTIDQVSIATVMFGNNWEITVKNADDYIAAVTGIKVNDASWTESPYSPSSGGTYYKNLDDKKLIFAAKDFSPNPTIPILKSGDVITISANGYEDFTCKLVIDTDGKATLVEDDGQGDPYKLHVKIDGSFEAAIVGQKDYDGVSSASVGGASGNKNSAVKVYGALVEKDAEPSDSDWEELDNLSKISLDGSKCSVSIVPDTEKGTPVDSDSGMEGVYMTISSDLTLNGTPKDAGSYLISVTITDTQGRAATSNTLPFRIYTGSEKLADQLKPENLKQYQSGLYAWDIMEPWAISDFGSNVDGENESVRVPADLEAWFGSHESGTYGYLGYDLPWKKVESGDIPQTLYIPAGCNLTLTNMKILSSVHIVIEKGGKLTLSDSVVQGIIDVQSGGTFSMNYDAYNGAFTTGASLCGQLRLADGAILENASIYSHANYLANGKLTDRTTSEPVVTATGNVTIKGKVFIKGDDAGSDIGQTALRVKDGTLKLMDGAELVAYGGPGKVLLFADGGTAIELDNARIEGKGKVTAFGGDVLWGNGGNAVTGNGVISTKAAFLQGATSNVSHNAKPGKAVDEDIKVQSPSYHIKDGTQMGATDNDPLAELYWKEGLEPTPPLEKFVTPVVNEDENKDNGNGGTGTNYSTNAGTTGSSGDNPAQGTAKTTSHHSGSSGSKVTGTTAAATGDTNQPLLWMALILAALAWPEFEATERSKSKSIFRNRSQKERLTLTGKSFFSDPIIKNSHGVRQKPPDGYRPPDAHHAEDRNGR